MKAIFCYVPRIYRRTKKILKYGVYKVETSLFKCQNREKCYINPLAARIFTVFGHFIRGQVHKRSNFQGVMSRHWQLKG